MTTFLQAVWTMTLQRLRGLGGARPVRRATSLALLYVMLGQPILSLRLSAETAGATAPEVTKFEPVDTTDLVNLASGDFTYNIPILNVPGPEGGYPLSLNYHSGIQHGEEATWVGLGWGLQPGSITRTVRGYPDDFYNVGIQKQFGSSSTYEYSVGVTFANSVGVGLTYNTSKGFGGYVSYGPQGMGARATYYGDGEWSVGIGYTMANGAGVGVSYGSSGAVGIEAYANPGEKGSTTRLGLSANTDAHGSTTVGVSAAMSQGVKLSWDSAGHTSIGVKMGGSADKAGGSASFSSYSGGGLQSEWVGISIPVFGFTIDLGYTEYWIDKTESELAYGYFNHHLQNASNDRVNEWIMESDPKAIPGDDPQKTLGTGFHYLPSYDSYTVMGQGTGGAIRPTRLRDWVYHPKRVDEWKEAMEWPWPDSKGFDGDGNRARFVFDGDNTEVIPADSVNLNRMGLTATRGSDGRGNLLAKVANLDNPSSPTLDNPLLTNIKTLIPGSGPLSIGTFNSSQADPLYLGKTYRTNGGSRVVNPLLDADLHTFNGFDIWESDGKRYLYQEAVMNLWSESVAGNAYSRLGDWFRSRSTINKHFAYAWYLSELRYPDYYDADMSGRLSDGDTGGWVKFSYFQGVPDYRWHTSPDAEFNDGPINRVQEVGQKKAGMMYGMEYGAKQLKYPYLIETATHRAFFSTSSRLDAKEVDNNPKVFGNNASNIFIQHPSTLRAQTVKIAKNISNSNEIKISFAEYTHDGQPFRPPVKYFNKLASMGILVDINQLPYLPRPWAITRWNALTSFNKWNQNYYPSLSATINTQNNPVSISMNGIPFSASSIEVEFKQDSYQDVDAGIAYIITACYATITINVNDQFWNNQQCISTTPLAFSSIRNAWSNLFDSAEANDGLVQLSEPTMQKLDDIYLIEKSTNKLVKQIHFDYSYDLCQGTPNSKAPPLDPTKTTTGGKLTLKSVQVFGQDGMGAGNRLKLPPYRFFYANNAVYGSKYAYDRWGFHKSDGAMWQHRDAVAADQDAWDLTRVQLPTGGDLYIQYEPKDYARVQDRRPQNASANRGMVGNYRVDVDGWLSKIGLSAWPATSATWTSFLAKVGTTPMQTFAPGGDTASGVAIPKVATTLAQTFAPLDSAPVPRDLVKWWSKNEAFTKRQTEAATPMGITTTPTGTVAKAYMPPLAVNSAMIPPASTKDLIRNTRMVNLVFEYFTAGNATTSKFRRMERPLDELEAKEVEARTEEDRRTVQTFSVLALIVKDATTNRTNLTVIDPDFRWPHKAPQAIYVTWTHPAAKIGGGVRVKRIAASDGKRSYATSYSYRDVVDGEWTTSGVAVTEPPPYGYSSDDDRVIFPEFGGWANEKGGGIVHSRVVVRHTWNEDPTLAGINGVKTPGGESVFRFISPADLPHRVSDGRYESTDVGGKTRRVKVTEIFNMGAWWGQLMWREDRDSQGRAIQRVENRYTQLDGYLRYFPRASSSDGAPIGTDTDVEYQYQKNNPSGTTARNDRSYDWAEKYTNPADRPLPDLADFTPGTPLGQSFTKTKGYLNASVSLTLAYRTDSPGSWWNANTSSVELVRELSLRPLVSETRTYSEGAPASKPGSVQKNMVWESRTGQVLETWAKGRTSPVGTIVDPNEWLISRTWPAYWAYTKPDVTGKLVGMFQRDDTTAGYGTPLANADTFASGVVNMLSQTTQSTTSRKIPGVAAEVYLNSKVETWWQPPVGSASSKRWLKGGDFVWNGSGAAPLPFSGYPSWTPASITDTVGGYQPYKANGWLFAGAVRAYDAYAHALEAVEGDGVWGCSKYGYHLKNALDGSTATLPAGILPIAKFANARDGETIYINFEDPVTLPDGMTIVPVGNKSNTSDDPLVRLGTAYTGERASGQPLALTLKAPTGSPVAQFELRYFVKAGTAATAKATYPIANAAEVVSVTQAEGGWWLVRAKVASGLSRTLAATTAMPIDDVSVFPWRRNGAPASVSHYTYDRALGLVTSITGSNGRTIRYRYDRLGRLMTVVDAYGNPSSATRYHHVAK